MNNIQQNYKDRPVNIYKYLIYSTYFHNKYNTIDINKPIKVDKLRGYKENNII